MKKLITLAFMANLCLAVTAQSDTLFHDRTLRVQGQIGINVTNFLKQFVVLNNTAIGAQSPFDVNGKVLVGWNRFPSLLIGPRAGFGYANTHTYSNNEQQTNERSTDNTSRALRAGLEIQQRISKRWAICYGIDYINQTASSNTVSTSSSTSGFPPVTTITRTEISTTSKTTGFGPILGIQFNINRWICLGTETSFYRLQSRGGSKTTSSNPNNTIPETFTDSKTTQFLLPFFINCNIVF